MVQGIIAGGPPALTRSQEGTEDNRAAGAAAMDAHGVTALDLVIGIAASGTTPYVHAALERAHALGARTAIIACSPPPDAVLTLVDVAILPIVGPEVVTGSTRMKAGTATKLVLNTITTGAMIRLGKTYGNLMVDLRASNEKLLDRARRMVVQATGTDIDTAAETLRAAGGQVKTAIVMLSAHCTAEEAVRRLDEAEGDTRKAIGRP
jgi:N-acetylmuramic acid 6-phosphate etherase